MKGKTFQSIISLVLISILVGSGAIGGYFQSSPKVETSRTTSQRIEFDNGTYVDITVDGNLTKLIFSDGALISVNATTGLSVIEFWESLEATNYSKITIKQDVPLITYPDPFSNEVPAKGTSVKFEVLDALQPNRIITSVEMAGSPNAGPGSATESVTFSYLKVEYDNGNSSRSLEASIARNSTHYGAAISANDSASPNEFIKMELYGYPEGPTNVTLRLKDDDGVNYFNPNITAGYNQPNQDSFFDTIFGVMQSGNQQDHKLKATTTESGGSFFDYTNITSAFSDTQIMEPGLPPLPIRYPSPSAVDDPTIPFDILDVILSESSVSIHYGGIFLDLYLDKLVINYETFGGIFIPIVILFEVWEVHISIFEVTIVIFLEVVELLMVVIVHEIVKIEVYIEYTVIIIEILEITLIEITIIHIDVDILVINIDITINLWVFKIIVKVVKKIIVFIPLWIIIIPVFIPIPVPVFIPVPTPVPVLLPQTNIDLYEQVIDESSRTMNLTYFVSDEYGNPLSNANVTLTMNTRPQTTYVATESSTMPGYYTFTNLPFDNPATFNVTADFGVLYRPQGNLVHLITLNNQPNTITQVVTQTLNITTTVPGASATRTTTLTVNGSQGTGTNPVPLGLPAVLLSFLLLGTFVSLTRKKRKH